MTVTVAKFTPEVMLTAPRRSAAVPNCSGTMALYTVSTYFFEKHTRSHTIQVLDIKSAHSTTLYKEAKYSEPAWISEREIAFVRENEQEKGCSLMIGDVTKPGSDPKEIQSFKGTISNLKTKTLPDGTVAIVCSIPSTPKGEMYNEAEKPKPKSTGRVYTKLYVRHWDTYCTENKSQLWYGALKKGDNNGPWELQEPGLVNAMAGPDLESPVSLFSGASDFDLGREGIVFVSSEPELNPALWTCSNVYYIPLSTFTEKSPPKPQVVRTKHLQGYSGSPVFSHCGTKLAFKRMRDRQYESDKWRLLLIPNIQDLDNVMEFFETEDHEGSWDMRPESIVWSHDDSELFVTAEEKGRTRLFRMPACPEKAKEKPQPLSQDGSIGDVFNLGTDDSRLLVTSTSLVDSSAYSVIDPESNSMALVSSISKQGKAFGLSQKQLSDMWYTSDPPNSPEYKVHALVMKPSNFDPHRKEKYPLAMLIHGGPQGAWGESWSTRWNPAVFAEQGYVVVMPNPTGSTGYGQDFTDAIRQNWGGRPYHDIERCLDHVLDSMPYVDGNRAVALGASYGGYMVNWIQGHPLGRRFRALVCHDGIFTTLNDWATEELFFPMREMGGTLWEAREQYERWDPARFVENWDTPQLIVHNELDYRLPITEGLAAFNALQTKGVDSRLLIFPDENHWVLKPENSLVWHQEVLGWINKYVGLDCTGLAGGPEA